MPHTNRQIEGYIVKKSGAKLEPFSYAFPEIGPWDVEIEISHCGVCHSDLHLINNDWGNAVFPFIPGHEIVGTVKQKGAQVQELEIGQRVGVGWQKSSCGQCEWCHQGEENLCLKQEATCVGHHGGYASAIVTDSRFVFPIPEALASENAAPLLCGGITVFSPLLQHQVNGLTRVGVIGIGGLGHLALQFSKAFGAEVFAFSSSPKKEEEAKSYGANHFISSTDTKALKKLEHSIDLLLSTSSELMDWQAYLSVLRPKGKLCLIGAPKEGFVKIPIFNMIDGRKMISGTNIGSAPAMRQMLNFASRHDIVAKTELFAMSDVNTALKKLAANQIHYRAVLCAQWS